MVDHFVADHVTIGCIAVMGDDFEAGHITGCIPGMGDDFAAGHITVRCNRAIMGDDVALGQLGGSPSDGRGRASTTC